MKLILYRGWPGAGKSYAAHHMFPGVLLVENDMFHMRDGQYQWSKENMPSAISWCIDMVKTALKNKFDVVVANTFTKWRFVEAYRKIAEEFGAEFHVYRCVGNFKNTHGLSDKIVKSFENAMEDWPGETIVDPNEFKI